MLRLNFILSLDRDVVRTKVIPEEIEKRRALFWELLHLDARLVRVGNSIYLRLCLSAYLSRASLSAGHLHCFTGIPTVHGQVIFLMKGSAALKANITVC
jgi:hypothetical protein